MLVWSESSLLHDRAEHGRRQQVERRVGRLYGQTHDRDIRTRHHPGLNIAGEDAASLKSVSTSTIGVSQVWLKTGRTVPGRMP